MKDKLKNALLQVFATKIGWLGVTMFLFVVFGLLANIYDWAYIAMQICLIYPVGLGLVMMAYAWVINPIRDYKENKKAKEDQK